MTIPTIEEYLQGSDWKFDPSIKKGCYGIYFWVQSPSFEYLNLGELVNLPDAPFEILTTSTEWHNPTKHLSYAGKVMLESDVTCKFNIHRSSTLTEPRPGAHETIMLLDEASNKFPLGDVLKKFGQPYRLNWDEEDFWDAITAINPYCYFSANSFIARGSYVLERLLDSLPSDQLAELTRKGLLRSRAELWQKLGPEKGPETCVEPNCERQRIELAIRCFIHQIEWVNHPTLPVEEKNIHAMVQAKKED